jgi:hypothetical protein
MIFGQKAYPLSNFNQFESIYTWLSDRNYNGGNKVNFKYKNLSLGGTFIFTNVESYESTLNLLKGTWGYPGLKCPHLNLINASCLSNNIPEHCRDLFMQCFSEFFNNYAQTRWFNAHDNVEELKTLLEYHQNSSESFYISDFYRDKADFNKNLCDYISTLKKTKNRGIFSDEECALLIKLVKK